MTRHKHADVLIAIAEGKAVQFRIITAEWKDYEVEYHHSPISSMGRNWDWRIKPEPKPDFVIFARAIINRNSTIGIDMIYGSRIDNLKLSFDVETGELKAAEVMK
ncbi:MAG: hypothetical protein RLZZ469_1643 [Bacteroidota bacterium]|jgi:hypothetical protein